ncbi:transglutaminase family protein [Jatrophihabitans sp. DSM 45814]
MSAPVRSKMPPAPGMPPAPPPAAGDKQQPRPVSNALAEHQVVAAATAVVAGGALLTMLPLKSVFTDWAWLVASVGCILPYLAVQLAFRLQGPPRWWHVVLGLFASALALAWVFIPQHLFLGILPTTTSLSDISKLLQDAHQTMQAEHAPVHSTPALRLLTAGATVLLVALTDVLCILLRRPLLAAAPLLEVLAVASATSSQAANPVIFACAAIGFLLILLAGTRLQDRSWGPSVDGSAGRLGGARRMAVIGIAVALVVPVVLPSVSVNLLARATHHGGSGTNAASGQRVVLNSAASLSGSLKIGTPVNLFSVQVAPNDKPFYLRQLVLDQFTDSGWVQSSSSGSSQVPVSDDAFPIEPAATLGELNSGQVSQITADIKILRLGGNALPLLANPAELQTSGGGVWNPETATITSARLRTNSTYVEQAEQPNPSEDELRGAPDFVRGASPTLDKRYLDLPALPASITNLARSLTQSQATAYDKARAVSDYFTNPKNGFVYSLDTAPSDGRSALETFLEKKRGFCQQYAAAAAVLMRVAGLPTRVVLGYTHQAPDTSGQFTVTTADAHAWVEVYFSGIGWVPFDPTPLSGADAGRVSPLVYAPHGSTPTTSGAPAASSSDAKPKVDNPSGAAAQGVQAGSQPSSTAAHWGTALAIVALLVVLGLLLAGPHLLRLRQRRRRLRRARSSGSLEPLWQELAATATDRGSLWPDTVTVRQVPNWLAQHGVDDRGTAVLASVAAEVERERFSVHGAGRTVSDDSIAGLDATLRRWSRRAERRQRLLNWWLPRSVLGRGENERR